MHTTTHSLRPRAGCRRRIRRAAGRICLALAVLLAFSGGARAAAAVDANTASREELQTIKGIGEATLRRMRDSGLVVGRGTPGRDARQGRVEERSPPGPAAAPQRVDGAGPRPVGERDARAPAPGASRGPARP